MPKEIPEILRYFLEDLLDSEFWYNYRAMFWWYGLYKYGKIFAILVEEEFYFKTWENNLDDYIKAKSEPFSYHSNWKNHTMCYYKIPENILEDRNELRIWIEKSLEVESNSKKKTKNKDIKNKDIKNKDIKNEVLEYLKNIPKWNVSTYKILANIFQVHPRTIASIMKQNKNQDKFPCYKVISSNGSLGWYNLWLEEKIKRLKNDWIEIIDWKIDKKYFYNE